MKLPGRDVCLGAAFSRAMLLEFLNHLTALIHLTDELLLYGLIERWDLVG
jgi:hypothetical protein